MFSESNLLQNSNPKKQTQMNKYTVISSTVETDLKNSHELSLFVRLWSGKYSDIEKDNLHTVFGMAKGVFDKTWISLVKMGYIVENEKGYFVTDEPSTDPVTVSVGLFEPENQLLIWLNKECPRVQRMKQPITEKQAVELMSKYSHPDEKRLLKRKFESMDSRPNLYTQYLNAFRAINNWMEKDVQLLRLNRVEKSTDKQKTSVNEF